MSPHMPPSSSYGLQSEGKIDEIFFIVNFRNLIEGEKISHSSE